MTVAYLRGAPISEADLLAHVGPGLATGADLAPISALAWNAFAYRLGVRLLTVMAPQLQRHELDIAKHALAVISDITPFLDADDGATQVAVIEATLRPMMTMSRSAGGSLMVRLYQWGKRRVSRDRMLADSLADLAAAACELHGELAELAGEASEDAIIRERTAQLADARAVLDS